MEVLPSFARKESLYPAAIEGYSFQAGNLFYKPLYLLDSSLDVRIEIKENDASWALGVRDIGNGVYSLPLRTLER